MSTAVRIHVRRNLIGYLALFVALGGTAWAAEKITSKEIAKNAVRAKHIKRGQVKEPTLADGAVTSPKVAAGSLLASDFAAGEVPAGPRGPEGAEGPRGPEGADGPRGPKGARGIQGVAGTARAYATVVRHSATSCAPNCEVLRGKGVTAVTRAGVGIYCVSAPGIDPDEVSTAVTVDWSLTPDPEGNTAAMPQSSFCADDQFGVLTERQADVDVRNAADNGVTTVSDVAVSADSVSFTIVIP